ncbi:MAG: hypothetical protein C0418_05665 [Coriobacteriaceae bacterium]|nr:hypothetical protein [Coriobacteriaceae bacterium]
MRRIKSHGIDVTLFVVLGSRSDTLDDFRRTLELADRLGVGVHPVLLTPLPGTELFAEYEPYLLPGIGWDGFTGTRAVFDHPDPAMTPAAREQAYFETSLELLSPGRIARHLGAIPSAGFPMTHLLSLMKSLPMRRAMRRAYDEWKAKEA